MTRLTYEGMPKFEQWLQSSRRGLGFAVTETQLAVGDATGSSWTVPLQDDATVRRALTALRSLGPEESKVWAVRGSAAATALHRRFGVALSTLTWLRDVSTAYAVLRPGAEGWMLPRPGVTYSDEPRGAARAAVACARAVAGLAAESTSASRAAAMRSVRQDHAWRPVQARGIRLDVDRLLRERTVVEEEVRRLRVENGVDLMAASDAGVAAAHAWLAANGVTVRDATGHPSLEQNAVAQAQVEDTTRARVSYGALLAARELGRTRGKLLELDRLRQGDRVYPQMIVRHTKTGRALARRPALQNLGRALRGMLMADPGYVLVSLDYHQVEPTVAAAMSGDARLAADVASGDVYTAAAAGWTFGGAPVNRSQAKVAFLACLYGRGPSSTAADLCMSEKDAASLIDAVWTRYNRLREYRVELQDRFAASEFMTTLGGRPLPALGRGELYKSLNWMIQGSAADIFEGGVMRVADAIGPEALFLGVHDELILHVPFAQAESARQVLAEQMPCTLGSVLITGDAEVLGTHWRK